VVRTPRQRAKRICQHPSSLRLCESVRRLLPTGKSRFCAPAATSHLRRAAKLAVTTGFETSFTIPVAKTTVSAKSITVPRIMGPYGSSYLSVSSLRFSPRLRQKKTLPAGMGLPGHAPSQLQGGARPGTAAAAAAGGRWAGGNVLDHTTKAMAVMSSESLMIDTPSATSAFLRPNVIRTCRAKESELVSACACACRARARALRVCESGAGGGRWRPMATVHGGRSTFAHTPSLHAHAPRRWSRA
jgi:hypothetical protein